MEKLDAVNSDPPIVDKIVHLEKGWEEDKHPLRSDTGHLENE
jgi:hypothetical protein